jgi:heat shock protein HtpX
MARRADWVFGVSYRVQAIGVASLLAVGVILAAVAFGLVYISPRLAVVVGFALVAGTQAAVAKRWTGVRPKAVSPQAAPEIHGALERLCVTGTLEKPRVAVHDSPFANSWVTGLTAKRTTLHLTSRAIELLDAHQLHAVIAHELSHIGQRDSRLMSAAGAPVAAMLDGAALYFHAPVAIIRGVRSGQAFRRVRSAPGSAPMFVEFSILAAGFWLLTLPLGLLLLVVGNSCRVITASFSRARELEADAAAARLTGNPAALASALTTLSDNSQGAVPLVDLRRAASLDAFHIVAIAKEYPLVHTHPSLRRRLKQLADIESRLQSPVR